MIEIIWEVLIPLASTALLVYGGLADLARSTNARRSHDVPRLPYDALGPIATLNR